jgi:peroxiredoxin Q/BCP
MPLPRIGSTPPAFTLPAASGRTVSLADYAGRPVLLWFFPRAYGGNCTKQACSFRDRAADYAGRNAVVLGITTSTAADLKAWGAEVGLASELLSDTGREVCTAYGALESVEQERPSRISVLIGADGKVARTWAVSDAAGHPAEALKDLAQIA